jgi:hypothetical protein
MAGMPELEMSVLPGTVLASHIEASAAGLAEGTVRRRAGACVETAADLAAVVEHLIAGQRHLSAALGQLGDYVRRRGLDPALVEVLTAAGKAAGFSADALAESRPLVQGVLDVTGADTHL